MAKIKHQSRKFLNKVNGTAAIEVLAESYAWSGGGVDATVSISDCRRGIMLDFSVYTKKDLPEKLYKLDVLITELTKLQQMLVNNSDVIYNAIDEADKKRKENIKKRKKTGEPEVVSYDEL